MVVDDVLACKKIFIKTYQAANRKGNSNVGVRGIKTVFLAKSALWRGIDRIKMDKEN